MAENSPKFRSFSPHSNTFLTCLISDNSKGTKVAAEGLSQVHLEQGKWLNENVVAASTRICYGAKLTADRESPEEQLVQIINGLLGEISHCLKKVYLIDLSARDVLYLIYKHLKLFRACRAKITNNNLESLSFERHDMELKVILAAQNKLHTLSFSIDYSDNKVLIDPSPRPPKPIPTVRKQFKKGPKVKALKKAAMQRHIPIIEMRVQQPFTIYQLNPPENWGWGWLTYNLGHAYINLNGPHPIPQNLWTPYNIWPTHLVRYWSIAGERLLVRENLVDIQQTLREVRLTPLARPVV